MEISFKQFLVTEAFYYTAHVLDQQSRNTLFSKFPPKFPEFVGHHVTIQFDIPQNTILPEPALIKVIGYAIESGLEAFVISVNGTHIRPDGKFYHLTWSIDRSLGKRNRDSNQLVMNKASAISPIAINCIPETLQEAHTPLAEKLINHPPIFCDLDGVLVDFDGGVQKITGYDPSNMSEVQMWSKILAVKNFYAHLDWDKNGRRLWGVIAKYNPSILTAIPTGCSSDKQLMCANDKKYWVKHNISSYVNCIVTTSAEKQKFVTPKALLIDDRQNNIEQWTAKGGVGILHNSRTLQSTLKQLRDLGY